MIIKKIESENFGPFKGRQSIELNEEVYSIICEYDGNPKRSNRGGKTSFVEMVLYCLYGETRGRDKVNFIHYDCDLMYVSVLLLLDNGEEFLIERSCDKKGKESLVVSGADGSNKDTSQEMIEQKVGVSYKDFVLSFYFKQQDISAFFDAKTTERKQVLSRWFEKEYWQDYFKNSDEDKKLIKEEIDKKNNTINDIKGEEFEVEEYTTLLNDSKSINKSLSKQYNEMFAKYQDLEKEYANKGNTGLLDEKLKNVEQNLVRLMNELESNKISYEKNVRKLDEIEKYKKEVKDLDEQISIKSGELSKYDKDVEKKYDENNKQYIALNADLAAVNYKNKIEEYTKQLAIKATLMSEREQIHKEYEVLKANDPDAKYKDACDKLSQIGTMLGVKNDVIKKIDEYGGVCPVTSQGCPYASSIDEQKVVLEKEVNELKNQEVCAKKLVMLWTANKNKLVEITNKLLETDRKIESITVTNEFIGQLQEEYQVKLNKVGELKSIVVTLEELRNEYRKIKDELNALSTKKMMMKDRGDEEKELIVDQGKIVKRNDEIAVEQGKCSKEKEDLINKIDEIKRDPEVAGIIERMNEVTNQLNSIRPTIDESLKNISTYELMIKQYEDKLKKCSGLEKEVAELNKKFEDLTFITYMFSSKGIPSIQIENSLEEIESETNVILEQLGTNVQIEFQSERELKSWEPSCLACGTPFSKNERTHRCKVCDVPREKKKKDDLDIYILEGDKRQLYELDSGGGKTLICFAFRNAIARMLQKTLNVSFNSIILDEILAPLDEVNTNEIVHVIINALMKQFGFQQVFMISHKSEVQTSLNKTIKIIHYPDEYYSEYKIVA